MPKKLLLILAVLLLSVQLFQNTAVVPAEEAKTFALTAQEKAYLESISTRPVRLAITSELMSFETQHGEFGLLKPLIDLMESEWGLEVEVINSGWSDSFHQLAEGEVDIMGLAILTEARKEQFYATEPLHTATMTVYTRISAPLISITNLDNSTIGLVAGSVLEGMLNQYIRTNTKVKYYATIDEMFTALSNCEVDCVISSLNSQSELLRYPDITCETDVETILPSQGIYAKNEQYRPLIDIMNQYLKSASGKALLAGIDNARGKAVIEKAREFYRDDIAYLNTHYTELKVYDSGVLYPFHFERDGKYEGIQEDANQMFHELTGMEIMTLPASNFAEGFLTALDKIKTGELIGATGIYYNKDYDRDADYIYSNPVYTDKLGFYATKELNSIYGLNIATTPFASPYVDWDSITGKDPVIYGDRGEMLKALRAGIVDAVFVSEMSVDYNYTIMSDATFKRAVPLEAEANVHLIAGSEHEVFVRLFNAANLLDKTLNKESRSQWKEASRNDKYELIRVSEKLLTYQKVFVISTVLIILILVTSLIIIYFNYRKFNNYDRQISQMLSTQKNADMLWGNTKTRRIISKGGFPFFKAWGFEIPGKSDDRIFDIFEKDLEKLKNSNEPYYVAETAFEIEADSNIHYVRHYTHKINECKFMVLALDVTDQKMREANLCQLANTDSLSSLLTRRAMEEEIENRIAKSDTSEPLYVLMFDIDNFKNVNDSYGHDIGDQTLVMVANVLRKNTCRSIASRWGGEEFLLAVNCANQEAVIALGNNILKTIAQKEIKVAQRTFFSVTVSCGIAPVIGNNYEKAIIQADKALYTAKKEGKNCVRYME